MILDWKLRFKLNALHYGIESSMQCALVILYFCASKHIAKNSKNSMVMCHYKHIHKIKIDEWWFRWLTYIDTKTDRTVPSVCERCQG